MKRQFTVFLAFLLLMAASMFVLAACGEKQSDETEIPTATAPVIAESAKTVELGDDEDLVYGVEWNGGTVTEIKEGQIALTSANYEAGETTLTVNGEFVSGLAEGNHIFDLVTTGGTAQFSIKVNDSRPVNPVVTPDKTGAFNTLDPEDLLTYTIDWGKGTFVSLAVGEEVLEKDTDYMIEGNVLSIVGKGLIDGWAADTYEFTLTTTTGSAVFELKVVMSGSRYLDESVFKTADGISDVSFSMIIGTNTKILSVKEGETELAATAYSYDAQAQEFAFDKEYLATLAAGIHYFVIALDDAVEYPVSIAVGTVFADNFENGNTNNSQITFGVAGNSNISGADAIDGKSVDLDLEAPNLAGTLLQVKNIALEENRLYVLHMTLRIDGKTQLIFVLPSQDGNQAWMNADGSMSTEAGQYVDSRSSSEEIGENIYELKIYLPVTAYDEDGINLRIYFRNGDLSEGAPSPQEHTRLVLDNIWMAENTEETFLPAQAPTVTPVSTEILSADRDVTVTVNNNYGTFTSLTENGEALTAGEDYTLEGETLTVKGSYLQSRDMAVGVPLTFTYNTVNPDNAEQTFAVTFTITYKATVWGTEYEKEYDGQNDVSFGVTMASTEGVSVKLNGVALSDGDYDVSDTSVTVKAAYLNTLAQNNVYEFKMTDASGSEFLFAVYVGCTAETVIYESFEDGQLPGGDNFGIVMTRNINRNGFDGVSATLSGTGTMIFVNREGFADCWTIPIAVGDTYEFSFRFKFAEGGKPVAGSGNDWGIFGGNQNILFAFGSHNFDGTSDDGKYAYIEVGQDGELTLGKKHCVGDKTSLTKDENGVYTFVLTFVAENANGKGGNALQVPCWMNSTFDIDNILLRQVPGVPTMSGSYIFDKTAGQDVEIVVNMHGSTFMEARIGDAALQSDEYTFADGVLTIKAAAFAAYEADEVLSLTVVSDGGVSAAVTISVADSAPFLTDGSLYQYGPDDELESLGLDANGHDILTVKTGDTVVPAENYTYDAQAKTFTFTESYLRTVKGNADYTIAFDGTSVTIRFTVQSMILDTVFSMDFEDGNEAAPIGQLGTQLDGLASLTQKIIADNGSQALKITGVPTGLVTVYSTISSVNMDPTYLYMFAIDITVKEQVPILFRFVEAQENSRDFFWIQADGSLRKEGLNPRYDLVKTNLGNGYVRYEIVAYATPTASNIGGNGNFEIATFADAAVGAFDVTIDNFVIAKTAYPILLLDFEDDDYKTVLGDGFAMSATASEVTGEESIGGTTSIHYTAGSSNNLLLIRPGNMYIGVNLIGGTQYKLSFKMQISDFPTDMNVLQMPIFGAGGDIGYVRPDPIAPGEPYIETPTGSGYTATKTVIDAEKDIYELSITWTNPPGKVEIDFSVWGAVDMVIDDICLEVVR